MKIGSSFSPNDIPKVGGNIIKGIMVKNNGIFTCKVSDMVFHLYDYLFLFG
jgi:hypothetical protein